MTTRLSEALAALMTPAQARAIQRDGADSPVYMELLTGLLDSVANNGVPTVDQLGTAMARHGAGKLHQMVRHGNAERLTALREIYVLTSKFLGSGAYGMVLETNASGQMRALKLYQTSAALEPFAAMREQEIAYYVQDKVFSAYSNSHRPAVAVHDWWRVVTSLESLLRTINADDFTAAAAKTAYRKGGDDSVRAIGSRSKSDALPAAEDGATFEQATDLSRTVVKPIQWFGLEMELIPLDLAGFFESPDFSNGAFQEIFRGTLAIFMVLERAGVRHNDAHTGNVRLRDLGRSTAITYQISASETVTINTRFAPVLADWGRSYVENLTDAHLDGLESTVSLFDTASAQIESVDVFGKAQLRGVGAKYDAYRLALSVVQELSKKVAKENKGKQMLELPLLGATATKMVTDCLGVNFAPVGEKAGYGGALMAGLPELKVTPKQLTPSNSNRALALSYVPWKQEVYTVNLLDVVSRNDDL